MMMMMWAHWDRRMGVGVVGKWVNGSQRAATFITSRTRSFDTRVQKFFSLTKYRRLHVA